MKYKVYFKNGKTVKFESDNTMKEMKESLDGGVCFVSSLDLTCDGCPLCPICNGSYQDTTIIKDHIKKIVRLVPKKKHNHANKSTLRLAEELYKLEVENMKLSYTEKEAQNYALNIKKENKQLKDELEETKQERDCLKGLTESWAEEYYKLEEELDYWKCVAEEWCEDWEDDELTEEELDKHKDLYTTF